MYDVILSCAYDGVHKRFPILLEYELDSNVSRQDAMAGFCGEGGELTVT
jgi:hypothetical protein